MYDQILISELNDFIFCPLSIYFHKLYNSLDTTLYQAKPQLDGKKAHNSIDNNNYSKSKHILTGIDVYCSEFNLIGKIDLYDSNKKLLVERKNKVTKIYDGYIFQLYAQYYAMREMGYEIEKLKIYSFKDNKNYNIPLPSEDIEMKNKFKQTVENINDFDINKYVQTNVLKCKNCIYKLMCDRSLDDD